MQDQAAVAVPIFDSDGIILAALEVRLRDVSFELRVVVPALAVAARGPIERGGASRSDESRGAGRTSRQPAVRPPGTLGSPCAPAAGIDAGSTTSLPG